MSQKYEKKIIYDIGMNNGDDTDFYLQRGFNVVGVEANPVLVAELQERFAKEVASKRLHIVGKAISSRAGRARFAVNRVHSNFGTLHDVFVSRNDRMGCESDFIEVECVKFEEVLREYGIPYYMKIDIEGCEMLCLEALRGFVGRPTYISLESCVTTPGCSIRDTIAELRVLRTLGYSRFKYVDQALIPGSTRDLSLEGEVLTYTFPRISSGPFGEETPGTWQSVRSAAIFGMTLRVADDLCGISGRLYSSRGVWRLRRLRHRLTGHLEHWYDLHAALA